MKARASKVAPTLLCIQQKSSLAVDASHISVCVVFHLPEQLNRWQRCGERVAEINAFLMWCY